MTPPQFSYAVLFLFGLATFLCFLPAMFRALFLEFKQCWQFLPVELTVRKAGVRKLLRGYNVDIDYEYLAESSPMQGSWSLAVWSKSAGDKYIKLYQTGSKAKGYFDPAGKTLYFTGRHYDLLDKIFIVFFLLVLPLLSILMLAPVPFLAAEIWKTIVAA